MQNTFNYFEILPWIAVPRSFAVSFRRAWFKKVAPSPSWWFVLVPGPFTLSLWASSGASPLQLMRLPHRMISEAQCTMEWIFSQHRYKRPYPLVKGNKDAHIDTKRLASASRRVRSRIVSPVEVLYKIKYYVLCVNTTCFRAECSKRTCTAGTTREKPKQKQSIFAPVPHETYDCAC